jgi:LytS/YehU family sensor histidine kinase
MNCKWQQQLTYAFVGLLAGDAALILYMLLNAAWARAALRAAHWGEPDAQIPVAIQLAMFYAIFSLAGFLVVGVPVALFLPTRFVVRCPWPVTIVAGSFLGPPAMLAIFGILGGGRVQFSSFRETGPLFAFSILVSTVSFSVYAALLRKQRRRTKQTETVESKLRP